MQLTYRDYLILLIHAVLDDAVVGNYTAKFKSHSGCVVYLTRDTITWDDKIVYRSETPTDVDDSVVREIRDYEDSLKFDFNPVSTSGALDIVGTPIFNLIIKDTKDSTLVTYVSQDCEGDIKLTVTCINGYGVCVFKDSDGRALIIQEGPPEFKIWERHDGLAMKHYAVTEKVVTIGDALRKVCEKRGVKSVEECLATITSILNHIVNVNTHETISKCIMEEFY